MSPPVRGLRRSVEGRLRPVDTRRILTVSHQRVEINFIGLAYERNYFYNNPVESNSIRGTQ
jgi:hypothetical protein